MRHLHAVLAASLVLLASAIGLGVATLIIASLHAETETAKEAAETHFRLARDAVERFGTGLADELARLPGSAPLRKRILLEVRQYHEQFVKHAAGDPRLQSDLASSHFWIGKITEDTGDADESLAAYRRALRVYAGLIRQQPDVDRYQADSALCHNNMALLHLRRGNIDAARDALQHALGIQRQLVRDHADQSAYRFELALTYGNLALLCAKTEALPQAVAAFDDAIRHKTDLVNRFPSHAEYRSSLAVTLLNLGGVLSSSDRNRAGQCCQQAIAIHQQLADSHPDDLDYSRDLALGYSQLGGAPTWAATVGRSRTVVSAGGADRPATGPAGPSQHGLPLRACRQS